MIWKRLSSLYRAQASSTITWEMDLSTRPVLYLGRTPESLQQAVYALQLQLVEQGFLNHVSGRFDDVTRQAVQKFQEARGLKVDGIVGPLTWAALLYPTLSLKTGGSPEDRCAIQDLQQSLQEAGFLVEVTGEFDRQTDRALRGFQRYYGLRPDGVAGPITWTMLKGQRPVPQPTLRPLSRIAYQCDRIVEQLLIIGAVWAGILWNPFGVEQEELSLLAALVIAYSLTLVGPLVLEKVLPKPLLGDQQPLLRYAPYVLVGLLWRPILQAVTSVFP